MEVAEITNSSGTVRIAAHVIAKIAGRIALSVPGVIGMDSDLSDTISQAIGMECTNGVHVSVNEAGASINLYILVKHGVMPSTCVTAGCRYTPNTSRQRAAAVAALPASRGSQRCL